MKSVIAEGLEQCRECLSHDVEPTSPAGWRCNECPARWIAAPSFAACPECGGDRGFESEPWGICRHTGAPLTGWIPCTFCDSTGEVETQPAGEEQFDEE